MNRSLYLLVLLAAPATPEQIEGRVTDAVTGETLARVAITLQDRGRQTITAADGRFVLRDMEAGEFTLSVSTVGYLPARVRFSLAAGEDKSFDVSLSPSTLRQSISVTTDLEGPYEQEAPLSIGLSGNELQNLASVLADDPLRAVQTLPGVISNDDFRSEFSIRGAGFDRVGVYLDGVLLHQPFHAVQSSANTASLTIVNSDTLDSLSLYPGPVPPQFADRSAAALDVDTREGNRHRVTGRFTASVSSAGGEAEGPIGHGRGSWLVSARKSYLQYIISRTSRDKAPLAFSFSDVQGRATYNLTPKNTVTISAVQGFSGLDRSGAEAGINSAFFSDYKSTLANVSWRYTPSASFLVTNRLAYIRERYFVDNRDSSPLDGGAYGEWIWNADARAIWGKSQELQFGSTVRRLREDSYDYRFLFTPPALQLMSLSRGTALRSGAYIQQMWSLVHGRISGAAGGRWDTHSTDDIQAFSPYASLAFRIFSGTRLEAAWGQSVQYPTIAQLTSFAGRPWLAPERSSHTQVSLEQRLGARTRARVEVYNRQDRDILFQSGEEPRFIAGRVYDIHPNAPWVNVLRGYSRGAQFFLQRRTANGFTGWVSYTYGVSKLHNRANTLWFPSDWDQRHTVNVYGSYRLRPTVNLSARWMYGSGLPIPGFFALTPRGAYMLGGSRNQLRLPDYQRLDLRLNKSWIRDRWQLTLFAEVINVLNRENLRSEGLNGYDSATGAARLQINSMLPILPSAGLTMQF